MLPVDLIAKFVCWSCNDKESINQMNNISSSEFTSIAEILEHLIEKGYSINLVDLKTWRAELLKQLKPGSPLFPLLPLYFKNNTDDDAYESNQPIQRCNFEEMLFKLNVCMPRMDGDILWIYLRFLEPWLVNPKIRFD
jgi:hypothetical protein